MTVYIAVASAAIIPASDPRWSPPVGYPFQLWVNKVDSKTKAKKFNEKMGLQKATLGSDLTGLVAAQLRDFGFTVDILDNVSRPEDDPDDVDYTTVRAQADAILHLKIVDDGMYSGPVSRNYIPRLNASGKLFAIGHEPVYDDEVDYGVDAKKGKAWAVLPDAKYAYPSFDLVMANIADIRRAFDTGVLEISRRMSQQICDAIKSAHPDIAQTCARNPATSGLTPLGHAMKPPGESIVSY